MTKILATGNLVDIVDPGQDHFFPEIHGSMFGLLCHGNFGAPAGVLNVEHHPFTGAGISRDLHGITYTGTRSRLRINEEGLYLLDYVLDNISITLAGGEDTVTNINYIVFVQERP